MSQNLQCIHTVASIATDADGSTKVCCMSSQRFFDNDRALNLSVDPIEKSWLHPLRSEIVNALEKGEQHPNCELCWAEERAGKASKRIRDNKVYENVEPRKDQPIILDLKLGHLCNLKCRTCGSHSSSKWIEEEHHTGTGGSSTLEAYRSHFQSYKSSFSEENPLWDTMTAWSKNIIHFDFYGGEPMLINRHWEALKRSVESGSSKVQTVKYNTNGTIFPDKNIHLYKHFKGLDVSISIDGIGERFTYIRHPAKWEDVTKNLTLWKNFVDELDIPFKAVNICLTISLLNLYYIDECIEKFLDMGFGIFLNLVHMPDYLSIQNFPQDLKDKISDKLDSRLKNSPKHPEVLEILKYMNQSKANNELWETFCRKTAIHDTYRQESFKKTFPEYVEFLGHRFKGE
jgi:MoaA/NifB/PqqE/SkfB family radical SAM enzyme